MGVGLGVRLWLTLGHDGYLGVDGGAYLVGVNAVLGDEPTGAGFPRPPLAPGWLLVPFTEILGIDIGYKVWASIASILPAIPVYLLARRIDRVSSTPAVFAAGFILLDLLHAEMIVTGALPLIGFALLGMVWWATGDLVERWSLGNAAILTVSLGLIPFVNQTTAGLALITIPVYALALMWFNYSASKNRSPVSDAFLRGSAARASTLAAGLRLIPPLLIGGGIALTALPWYLKVLPVSGVLNYPGPFIYLTHAADSAWLQFFFAIPLGIYMIAKGSAPWLRALGVLCVVLGTLLLFLSTDETIINVFYRSRYLLAFPAFVGLAWAVFTQWLPRMPKYALKPSYALLVAAVVLMAAGYVSQFDRQSTYSRMISNDTKEALALIPGDGKAVINNSFTMALWIAALRKTEAPHTWTWNPPPTWTQTDLDVRCVLGWRPECDPIESVHALNAGYVLLELRFPYYNERAPGVFGAPNEAEPWASLPDVPWLSLMYAEGTTQLWRIE